MEERVLVVAGYAAFLFAIIAGAIYWLGPGQRRFKQSRARNWTPVDGKFDEGEVITMRRARSGTISGFQVWMGYEYHRDGDQGDLYILPFKGEFATEEEAEQCRRSLAERPVTVRVSPSNPTKSAVLDEDVKRMVGDYVP